MGRTSLAVGTTNNFSLAAAGTAARATCWPTYRRPLNGLVALTLLIAVSVGCSEEYKPSSSAPTPQPAVESPPPAAEPAPAKSITVQQQKAAVGVGKKGRDYGEGFVATPIGSMFAASEKIIFDIKIPHAMNLFKAQEDRPPKDHEEFMEKIIKANHIELPELPDDHRYRYDPETELLMVLSPAES